MAKTYVKKTNARVTYQTQLHLSLTHIVITHYIHYTIHTRVEFAEPVSGVTVTLHRVARAAMQLTLRGA